MLFFTFGLNNQPAVGPWSLSKTMIPSSRAAEGVCQANAHENKQWDRYTMQELAAGVSSDPETGLYDFYIYSLRESGDER
ncbi:hypothetical protein TRV_00130 [Trichophyton verrucosum HKI 0517]|uniref:Uncharacterized protein n=1 Tax=Trichophyton verrucosum (strain HKI 0517) TaxID=663202 RepID=D4CZ93_TRIVH|nr:uncharacterized protein TRV_00130 [Trichophyton verrucosum HKI 0517]EFE45105.1 hypothetical protein TRV_00130 [Trichophyton verrucosum HKI 0517]